jgi:WD40 repeat protein
MAHDAFISYSRKDRDFAIRLQKALANYTPQKDLPLPHRRVDVFRDEEDFTGAEYYQSLDRHLTDSSKLIVLCSPAARASRFVDDEIRRFGRSRGPQHIIPLLVAGIPNHEAAPGQEARMAFPEALCESMQMPLAADYRDFDPRRSKVDRGRYETSWYTTLANIFDISRAQIEQREKKRRARRRYITLAAGAASAVLLVCLSFIAWKQITVAQRRATRAASDAQEARRQTEQSLAVSNLQAAETAAAQENVGAALANVARALRLDPANVAVRAWTFDYLVSVPVRRFSLPHHDVWAKATFSPDGTRLVSWAGDRTVRVWDTRTGEPVGTPLQHAGIVEAASFIDGIEAVVTVSEGTLRVWDVNTGQAVESSLPSHLLEAASLSADGTRVALLSDDDQTVEIRNVRTGRLVAAPLRHPANSLVLDADLNADGTTIATMATVEPSDVGTARVWHVRSGGRLELPLRHRGNVLTVAVSRDGTLVVTAGRTAQVWLARTGQPHGPPLRHQGTVVAASFSPDGMRLITGSNDGMARVWDTTTGQLVGIPLPHQGDVRTVKFSPDGRQIVTVAEDGVPWFWDAHLADPIGVRLPHQRLSFFQQSARAFGSFSADGTRVVTPSMSGAQLSDPQSGHSVGGSLQHHDSVEAAAFSADGTRVITAARDRTARVWDARTAEPLGPPLNHQDAVLAAAFVDATRVVTASMDGMASAWDARTGQSISKSAKVENLVTAAFSRDGRRLVTVSAKTKTAQVWDTSTWQQLGPPLRSDLNTIGMSRQFLGASVSFSADGNNLLTAGFGAQVWDVHTGRPIGPPLQHKSGVLTQAFNTAGTQVVTGSSDWTAQVWDARTGSRLGEPMRHRALVRAVAFSGDASRIVTASRDRTVRVWDAQTGRPMGAELVHDDDVLSAEFSPDATRVLTVTADGTAQVWDVQVGTPADAAALANFAETVGGLRVTANGALEPVENLNERLQALKQQAAQAEPGRPGAASFIRWYFEDPWTRTTSPLSGTTVPQYIDRMLTLGGGPRAEAERAFRGHPRLKAASR